MENYTAPESFVKCLDYEYTCRTKDDDAVPPPRDWTLNVCWSRFPQASKRGEGDDVAAFQSMTSTEPKTKHKLGHWGYFCLPANVALKICRYIVHNHSTDKPIRLSTSSVYNGPYPVNQNGKNEFFESVDQASCALSRYWHVSHSFKLDVQAAFFLTRRFHLVISPFGPTADMGWLHSHGRFVKNITIEFDCTKHYGGKPMMRELDEATGCPELFDKKQLQKITAPDKDARRSVDYYKLTLKPVLEHLISGRGFPIDRLTIMVRKYHGSRENMPRGYPYFDPTWLNFLLLIPRVLQSNVLSLETIGVPPRLLGLIIHRFWREGKPPTEDAQRQHFRWGPFPPTLWPLMPGHTAAVSVPGSIDPTVDRLLRLDHPGEVAIFPLPEEESQESRDARAAREMLEMAGIDPDITKWKAKKPPSSGTAVEANAQRKGPGDFASTYGSSIPKKMDELEKITELITAKLRENQELIKKMERLNPWAKQTGQRGVLRVGEASSSSGTVIETDAQEQAPDERTFDEMFDEVSRYSKSTMAALPTEVDQKSSKQQKAQRKKSKKPPPQEAPIPQPEQEPKPVVQYLFLAGEQPQTKPPSGPSVVAEYLSFYKEMEDEAKAMEQQQQQQQQTQQPRRLSRLLKFMNPGKGEAGPSGSLTATKAMLKEAEPAGQGRQSQRARDRPTELANVLDDVDEFPIPPGFFDLPLPRPSKPTAPAASASPISMPMSDGKRTSLPDAREDSQRSSVDSTSDPTPSSSPAAGVDTMADGKPQAHSASPITPTGSTTANATTGTTAGPATFENKDSGLGLWETEDTAFSVEQPWIKVEKKSRRQNGSKQLQVPKPISQTKTNKKSTARQVQTSLQNLKREWAATAGESSKKTKHHSKKAESIAGSSKKGETKKAGENKSVKSGSTATSALNSRESRSSFKAVRLAETRAPPSPPRTSELHIAGSQLDKPGKTKAEDKDAESGIALIVKETGSKDSVGTPPSSQSSLPTLHLSMEVPAVQPTLSEVPEKGESHVQSRSPPRSPSDRPPSPPLEASLEMAREVPKVRLPLPKNDESEKPTRSPPQSASDRPPPRPLASSLLPTKVAHKERLPPSRKMLEVSKKQRLARTKAFRLQGQQQHFHPAGPFPSAPYPYSQLPFQSQTEASALYNHYRKPKELALGMLPTMGGSRTIPQYSHAPMMSQAPPMPIPQDQWQPMYQAQVPVMHPWGPTAQMPPVFTMSQMPGVPQVPVMPLYQMQPMSQMQPMPQTQAFIHPQPNIHTNCYQVPPPTTMSQVPPNPPAHFPQPLWISQPTYQAPQPMYPVQQTYQAPPSTYYPSQPPYPEAQTGNIGQEWYSTQQGY
ncbi:hypothetical protein QBC45DRAFT_392293 [Copromyces sp. CBS 386.78]|nr:hypothetical protein QBC45DRAFT_392293 [Copromyces sp. CBS 386.78]